MKKFEVEIGKRIRLLREKAGYSREALSEMAHIGAKFLYEIESGKKGMSAYTLYNLSCALNVSCDYILKGAPETEDFAYITSVLSSIDKSKLPHIERIVSHIADISKTT